MLERITRRTALLSLFAVFAALLMAVRPASSAKRVSAPPRPLVIVYAIHLNTGPKVIAAQPGVSPEEEMALKAARAVKDRLDDSNAVTAVIFDPESPLFKRAAQEAKITFGKRREVTPDEQIALAKMAGAIYSLAISTQSIPDGGGNSEIIVSGIDLDTKKVWSDRAKFMTVGGQQQSSSKQGSGDANAVRAPVSVQQADNSLISAANTIVTRLLNGPLGDYGRVAVPTNLLPPPLKNAADTIPAAEAEAALAAYDQADVLLAEGDTGGAIVTLRRAISQSPLNPKLRLLLVKAYVAAKRPNEAASEAKRSMQIAPPTDEAGKIEMTRLIAEAFAASGDRDSARAAYEQVIASQPGAVWARMSLAAIHQAEGRVNLAADQYRAVLKTDPGNKEAATGLAHILAAKGDFKAALAELGPDDETAATPAQRAARHAAATVLFDEYAPQVANLMAQNRQAWEAKTLSREAFYKATSSQQNKITALLAMLRASTPDPADITATKAHTRRIHAATLLAQAATSLVNYLETGNADSGSQAALWLNEFQKELAKAQGRE
jgi:thioredoxin-like negative regulator of GroEL